MISALAMSALLVGTTFAQTGYASTASTSFQEQRQEGLNRILERLELKPEGEGVQAQMEERKLSEDTLVVRYSSPLSTQAHSQAGTTLQKRISSLGYDVVKIQGNAKMEDVIKRYASMSQVRSVQPSVPVELFSQRDPKSADMYHLDTLNIEEAWKLAGDHEVVVGVVDTGLDRNHPELKNQLIGEYNSHDPMKRPLADLHGTHVSGIIAAEAGNGIGGYGVNPDAKILSIDVFNRYYGFDYDIAEGILYAVEQEVDVINLSLGTYYPSPVLKDAVEKAIDAGIVVVAAAGNENTDQMKPYPAGFPGVISVGATNDANERAFFTNYGAVIDVVAPGEDVYGPAFDVDKHSTFDKLSGTSMSSPIVAGVASLLLSKHPDLTPYQVKYILEQTAQDIGEAGYDLTYGYGMIDPVAALQFDVTSIPTEPAMQEAQVTLQDENKVVLNGHFDAPKKEYRYQMAVEEGDLVQFVLEGTDLYDLAFTIQESSARGDADPIEVDETVAGGTEARLYEAERAGTLTVTVKDANGKYSQDGTHQFEFTAEKATEYKEDGLSATDPLELKSLPYSSASEGDGPLYLAGEDGDRDFFRFTSEEGEMVQVDVSGVPGVEVGIRVYMAEEFDMYYGDDSPFDEEMLDEGMGPYPMYTDQMYGVGEDKTLTFETFPEMEYVIEVTSLPLYFNDPFFMMFMGMEETLQEPQYSSHLPYTIEVKGEVLPPDEDGFPMMGGMTWTEEVIVEEEFIEQYHQSKEQQKEMILDWLLGGFIWFPDESYIEEIINAALPISLEEAANGYFQTGYDQDVFTFTPEANGLYELSWNKTETLQPVVEVLRVDEEEEKTQLTHIAYSNMLGIFDSSVKEPPTNVHVGLEEGETYIFIMTNQFGYGQASLDQYELELELVKENVQDSYWKNNDYEYAKPVPNYTINGNMAMTGSPAMFYYEAEQDELVGLHFASLKATAAQKQGLPDELFKQILPFAIVVEDTNGDGELSDREKENVTAFLPMYITDTEIKGSFQAKKDAGYFVIITNDSFYNGVQTTLAPYQLTVSSIDSSRAEDSPFYGRGSGKWETAGFLPVAAEAGKTETKHSLNVQEAGTYDITLTLPEDVDGVLTVYNEKGNVVTKVDHYGQGDSEMMSLNLKVGKYTIGVQDANGNSSLHAYRVKVVKR